MSAFVKDYQMPAPAGIRRVNHKSSISRRQIIPKGGNRGVRERSMGI